MSDLSPEGRALFRSARAELEPNAGDRARVAQQIALHVGVGAVAVLGSASIASASGAVQAGAASAVPSTALAIIAKGLGLGLLIGITVPTSYWLVDDAVRARAVTHSPMVVRAAVAPTARRAVQPEPAASMPPVAAPNQPEKPANIAPALANAAPPAESSLAAGTVGEEARLLSAANAARVQGNASRALVLLLQHERRFPSGVLSEERSAELVVTFCQLGRITEARQEAERFLRTAPQSALAPRVRASCVNLASEPTP